MTPRADGRLPSPRRRRPPARRLTPKQFRTGEPGLRVRLVCFKGRPGRSSAASRASSLVVEDELRAQLLAVVDAALGPGARLGDRVGMDHDVLGHPGVSGPARRLLCRLAPGRVAVGAAQKALGDRVVAGARGSEPASTASSVLMISASLSMGSGRARRLGLLAVLARAARLVVDVAVSSTPVSAGAGRLRGLVVLAASGQAREQPPSRPPEPATAREAGRE